jgi:phosphonate transport system permease protein
MQLSRTCRRLPAGFASGWRRGIGMIIIERFRANMFDQVTFVVINVLICVFAIDWLSKKIRDRYIGEQAH